MPRNTLSPEDAKCFGLVLRALRERAGLSRAKVAKRARISEASIKLVEAGHHFPTTTMLYSLLRVADLGLTPSILHEQFRLSVLGAVEYQIRATEQDKPEETKIALTLFLTFKGRPK